MTAPMTTAERLEAAKMTDIVREYLNGYEFRFECGGGYAPNEHEQAMLEDFGNGLLAEIEERKRAALTATALPAIPEDVSEQMYEASKDLLAACEAADPEQAIFPQQMQKARRAITAYEAAQKGHEPLRITVESGGGPISCLDLVEKASEADALVRDAERYRHLQIIGCAPFDTPSLANGTVMRFSNLDAFVDEQLRVKKLFGRPAGKAAQKGR